MRKTLYAISGSLVGAILFAFLLTEIPEVTQAEKQSELLIANNLEEFAGINGNESYPPFFAKGTYHIKGDDEIALENKGVIAYGKVNPMFYYKHAKVIQENEAASEGSSQSSVNQNSSQENGGDVKVSDPNSKGGSMIVKGDSIIYDGFDLESRTYKQVEISEALFDFTVSGVIPIKEEHYHISSSFGTREDPFEKVEAMHTGTDFSSENINSSEVYSVNHGRIEKIVEGVAGYGNYVIINHNGYSTLYAHLESFSEMKEGDFVRAGAVIGKVGNTGRSTGPHLHFEVRIGEITVDPEIFLNRLRGENK